ncbi:sulfate transporter family-domain-containing protein [Aspergillus caelatus]|uniref:Sulfate transporter family-domain-containing protein n=2 Tax=Aspergillus subgen. Circumdati TaxID=2720871 RepID=A0A5N7AD91_9EURO|nr:sulfate transporter family-domain-containing protein [Aspergillus caelatus]KAE8367665.1 sulfate transporter family-domain-containing protein [Aspergillus caelatus]KAE8418762.1 sulfate transporter family-domain-containing protein [Aspergillus pseudocaelatus]
MDSSFVQEPTEQRSLRDRILNLFRNSSSNNDAPGHPTSLVTAESAAQNEGSTIIYPPREPDARTRLLQSYDRGERGLRNSGEHGTFSSQPEQDDIQKWDASSLQNAGHEGTPQLPGEVDGHIGLPSDASGYPSGPENIPSLDSSFTALHMKNQKSLYISYYIPFFNWITQYRWSYIRGDLIAATTVASIYIPMALSLSSNLAHAPAVNGLYSFVINPFIYAIFGSSPLLIVGPEAAGSLLTGTIVKTSVRPGPSGEDDEVANAMVVGVATAMAGAMILIAGLTRLGFLDNVLSRPFLRGFITAIGFVIFVDQLIPEVGLSELAKEAGVTHGTTVDKLMFLGRNIGDCHALTSAVAFGCFAIIMVFRTIKKMLQPRYPQVIYLPDRILVVILSAVLTWHLGWDEKGLEILGPLKHNASGLFAFKWPFQFSHMKHVRAAMSTSFVIALLGFFESSVAAKGLSGEARQEGVQGMPVSANREMVALGLANTVGGCFMALPAFGGYARSKVNASTGARSPMSSIFLSIITFVCIMVLLPYLYYLPKAVLSSMISVVAFSLIEECPHDVAFFIRLRGWTELILMLLIFVSTIFYSLELGIALGIGLSILILIRHSTQPRIQILGKIAGTTDRFENAELHPENVELIEGALIVKIPEPLTFANTGELKNRLRRLELYGSSRAHPSLPPTRTPEHNKNIIFDVHGVTSIDGSGTQVLYEIVDGYADQGVSVFFCRVPTRNVFRMFERSGIVERCGGIAHFVDGVDEALRLAESEDQIEI